MPDIKEPLSNISDSSFIILGQGSLPPSITNETSDVEFSDKGQNAFVVFESDKSLTTPSGPYDGQSFLEDNLQEKLKQLIRENAQLKETLSQNNLAIKSQLDAFYMWQKEVLKTHETHKEKFMETRDLILKLRAENLNLKKQLDEGFCTIGDDEDDDLQMRKKCDCDKLKQETEKLRISCEDLTHKNEILEMENTKLREKLNVTEKEVFKLNGELEDICRENKVLKLKSDELGRSLAKSLNQGSLPNEEIQAQMSKLFKQLELERWKASEMKDRLIMANKIIDKAQNLISTEKVDEYLKTFDELKPLKTLFDRQNQTFNTLQDWVTLTDEIVESGNQRLLNEIGELKSHIHEEEKKCKQKQEDIDELKYQFNRLLKDYKQMQQVLSMVQDKNSDFEKDENEKVSHLSQLLESKENELSLKQQECDQLKEDIKKLNLEFQEEVAVLKAQLGIYKSDFEEERAARENVVGERELIAEKLRYFRQQLKDLKKGLAKNQNKENGDLLNSFSALFKEAEDILCPTCLKRFCDEKSLHRHLDDCLDIFSPF